MTPIIVPAASQSTEAESNAQLDLLSIGSWAIFDHIAKMETYPSNGQTVRLEMPLETLNNVYYGDCSANVAAVAARLGIRGGLAMIVGDDFTSSGYAGHLTSLGVDLTAVDIRDGQKSGHNFIYFDTHGDGFCLSHLGIAANQASWPIPEPALSRARSVVINEMFSDFTLRCIRRAKALGALAAINGMVGTAGQLATSFLREADILFISENELNELLALIENKSPRDLLDLGPQRIFVTKGSRGSEIISPEKSVMVPAIPAEQVVDTTGAGDAYVAGTMAALLRGDTEERAALLGAAVASYVVEAWGAQTRLPTMDEAEHRCRSCRPEEYRESY